MMGVKPCGVVRLIPGLSISGTRLIAMEDMRWYV